MDELEASEAYPEILKAYYAKPADPGSDKKLDVIEEYCGTGMVKKVKLNGVEVTIDEEMVPAIIELNKIGLKTQGCCSGHPDRKNTKVAGSRGWTPGEGYIAFLSKDVHVDVTPRGWVFLYWKRSAKGAKMPGACTYQPLRQL